MLTRRIGSVLLVVQGSAPPSDSEWNESLEILRPFVAIARVLVLTEGGGPDPSQRKRLSAVIGGNPIRVAILTNSAKVRFIGASIAFFIRRIRCFMLSDTSAAFKHIDLTVAEIDQLTGNIRDMQDQLIATHASSTRGG
jgi:hypothetical protein